MNASPWKPEGLWLWFTYLLAHRQVAPPQINTEENRTEFLAVSITVMSITEMKIKKNTYIHSTYTLHLNDRCCTLMFLPHQSSHCIWSWRPVIVLGIHFPQNPPHLPYILVPSWKWDRESNQSREVTEITVVQKDPWGLHTIDILTNQT